ncbi:MAG: hypothetical protein WBG37_07040 [Desulfobacterales bacterium]|jgi:actin-like ATPase involved in cell morphogenesis
MVKKKDTADKDREAEIAEASAQIAQHQTGMGGDEAPVERVRRAVGVDVGTSKIVFAERIKDNVSFESRFNAFIPVEYSKFSEGILKQNKINYFKTGDSLIVFGDGAEVFADMLNKATRRPMRQGLLNPTEENAVNIIHSILDDLVVPAIRPDTQLCFSIPGVPRDLDTDIIYHEAVLKRHLAAKGYQVKSINEGMAVVLSELGDENFTGMGISAGGGMCNVCLSYLSVPMISFSLNKGGDYIDEAVASVTSEVSTRIRKIKETELDLTRKPRNDIEDALHIYHEDLISTLIHALGESLRQSSKAPKMDRAIPIVLSGGSVLPKGFKKLFESALDQADLPLKVSEVRLAKDPLNATANGALIAAMYED